MKKLLTILLALATCGLSVFANIKGDVNGDGFVTSADITAIFDVMLGTNTTLESSCDINGDGNVTSADVTAVYDVLLGNDMPEAVELEVNGVKFKMVEVEGGTFMMGNSNSVSVDQAHQVTLNSFAIGQTEVTQELWKAVMGSNPSYFNSNGLEKRPVEQVSWNDCQQFIDKLNQMLPIDGFEFCLPTEAQWEYAARGGNKSHGYIYAGSNNIGEVAWYSNNSINNTHAVGLKVPNELGLYDMSGNVEEWCQDWKGDYPTEPQTNPTGSMSGNDRVLRGGYFTAYPNKCQVSYRDGWGVDNKDKEIGLRLALVPEKPYKEYTVNGVTFKMINVKGGTFMMGATSEQEVDVIDNGPRPVHSVTLSSFRIGETQVTQELWQAVMGNNPSWFNGQQGNYNYGTNLQRPVETVSWNDCQLFITKLNQMTGLNFRLPTEAEWEYAARGGNKSKHYKFAGGNSMSSLGWYYSNAYSVGLGHPDYGTHAVATKLPNELGLYDMSGNVNEWCQDWYGAYSEDSQTNPMGPTSGSKRVMRGGAYRNFDSQCRVSSRDSQAPNTCMGNEGLRLVMSVE